MGKIIRKIKNIKNNIVELIGIREEYKALEQDYDILLRSWENEKKKNRDMIKANEFNIEHTLRARIRKEILQVNDCMNPNLKIRLQKILDETLPQTKSNI